ncbi:FecCD family ABC transporter permease [Senegalia sp. (in: firmicutes)]|uniref:FecCD family ABC transporter permease n=1 Tax=Senegalia sp. (in: firmicutes) TaxID=1924098 RepID=UPI003F9C5D54
MIENKILNNYNKKEFKKIIFLVLAALTVLIVSIICTSLGVTDSSLGDVWRTIIKGIRGSVELSTAEKVILNLRLPRTILGLLAGVGLSISGVIMQGITRNPLVSPFTIGVSSAAGFGASLAIVFGFGFFGSSQLGIITNAFIASMMCTMIIFLIARKTSLTSESIILTGIALNYLFQASSTTIQFIADDNKLAKVINWTFGTINGAEWSHVKAVGIFVIPCFLILLLLNNKFTIMSTVEDDLAKTMGINPTFFRMIGSILAALSTAAVISFTGVIGFIGLAAPHITRAIIGNNYKYLLPGSALMGALLITIADTIGRLILSPIIVPVGIVISFLGVPIFLHQVVLNRRDF